SPSSVSSTLPSRTSRRRTRVSSASAPTGRFASSHTNEPPLSIDQTSPHSATPGPPRYGVSFHGYVTHGSSNTTSAHPPNSRDVTTLSVVLGVMRRLRCGGASIGKRYASVRHLIPRAPRYDDRTASRHRRPARQQGAPAGAPR